MAISSARDVAYMVSHLRRQAGVTQQELAMRAGVSVRWLSNFESGKTTVELAHVLRVYQALGYNFDVVPR